MKTKLNTTKSGFNLALTIGAMLACGLTANAQNVSYNVDGIPLPGFGTQNVVVSNSSMLLNAGGSVNTAIGELSLNQNVNGGANSAGGYAALYQNDGQLNTAFGAKCVVNTTTGNNNSGLGVYALGNNVTGNNNTGLGFFADVAGNNQNNSTAVGNGAVVVANDQVWLGDANVAINNVWSFGTYNTASDGRFKTNISESDVKGLSFINLLRPVVYNFDAKKGTEFMTKNMTAEAKKNYLEKDFTKATSIRQSGFIAQEVAEAAKKSGYDFNGIHTPTNENDIYGISYGQLVVPLVKGMQEQQAMIEKQGKMIEELKQQLQSYQSSASGVSAATGINTIKGADGFALNQNEPNPFVNETVIKYTMPQSVNSAYVAIYDLSGKQITTFGINERGASSITITSDKLAAGIYIYSVVADGKIMDSKRMVVSQK